MAPRVFISYTHDSDDHRTTVHEFAKRLRGDGVDVRIDRWVEGTPSQGWPAWMEDEIDSADYILLVCTARYHDRYRGIGDPAHGRGARWESNLVRDALYADRSRVTLYVPLTTAASTEADVPASLRHSVTRYDIDSDYEELYRFLTAQHADPMPPLGPLRVMPTSEAPGHTPLSGQAGGGLDGRQGVHSAGVPSAGQLVIGQIPGRPQTFIDRAAAKRLSHELDGAGLVVVTALTGMRGVGKTQIAAAYARQAVDEGVRLVAWVNADTVENLNAGLVRVAGRVLLATADHDPTDSVQLLREYLAVAREPSVLVFDNATDARAVAEAIPSTGRCKVVVTSTDRSFDALAKSVDVSSYERPESVDYLARSTGLTDDRAGASAVADALGDLPLALSSASAHIRHGGIGYGQCLEDLRNYPVAEVLTRIGDIGYPAETAAALLLAVDSVDSFEDNHAARSLIEIVATLSPEGVSRESLYRTPRTRGDERDVKWTQREVDRALEQCVASSLLTWSESRDSVIMHRLMRRIVVERTSHHGRWNDAINRALTVSEPDFVTGAGAWATRDAGLRAVDQIRALAETVLDEDSPSLSDDDIA